MKTTHLIACLGCVLGLLERSLPAATPSGSVDSFYGSFGTEIPIAIPKYHGLEPNLKLTYSSGGGQGWFGVGWSLSGLSVIERASPGGGAPRYDSSDVFYLDGMEVIPYTARGGTHATKIENYTRITQDTAGDRWTVIGSNGNKATYAPIYTTPSGTFRWLLNRVEDLRGNSVLYNYWLDTDVGNAYLQITYNGATITFFREPRPDIVSYADGLSLRETRYRVPTISVQVGVNYARAYKLTYGLSLSSGRSVLTHIQQYGRDVALDGNGVITSGSALPAMTLGYQTTSSAFIAPQTISLPEHIPGIGPSHYPPPSSSCPDCKPSHFTHFADFDGDKRADYMWFSLGSDPGWYVAYGSREGIEVPIKVLGSSFQSVFPTWSSPLSHPAYLEDFNGDGRTDYLWQPEGHYDWYVALALSDGRGFASPALWLEDHLPGIGRTYSEGNSYALRLTYQRIGDFNGDGNSDFMWWSLSPEGSGGWYIAYSTGNGFATPIRALAPSFGSGRSSCPSEDRLAHVADFNGDGKTDYLWQPANENGWCIAYSTGGGFSNPVDCLAAEVDGIPTYYTGGSDRVNFQKVGDFNGDGKTDYLWYALAAADTGWYVAFSTGSGLQPPKNVLAPTVDGSVNTWAYPGNATYILDLNGDGRADYMWQPANLSDWYVALSAGSHFATPTVWLRASSIPTGGTSDFPRQSPGDFNGDGKPDYLFHQGNGWYLAYNSALVPDLLARIENGIGGTTDITYTSSSEWENGPLPSGLVLQTVSRLLTSDGRGNTSATDYFYAGGLWSWTDKRFLGFRKVTAVIDPQGSYTETYYFQRVGSISKPEYTYFRDNQGAIFSYSQYAYTENTQPPYTSLLTDRWDFEVNLAPLARRTLTQFAYDQYANVVRTYEHGDFDLSGDERTTVRGYYPNPSNYLVGLPAFEMSYAGIGTGGPLLKYTRNYYDGGNSYEAPIPVGNLTRVEKWNDQTGGYVSSLMKYDAWGNLIEMTNERGYKSYTTFDTVYHLYPLTQKNALGHIVTSTWDTTLSVQLTSKDPNGAIITYTYDPFGRETAIKNPYGHKVLISYLDWGNPHLQRVRHVRPDGSADGLWTETYQDGLGRTWRTTGEGGFTVDTIYSGTTGRIWKKSLPYKLGTETPVLSEYAYDGVGRLRTLTNPDGSQADIWYSNDDLGKPYQQTFDEVDNEKMVWKDAYGNLAEVAEKDGTNYFHTIYEYNNRNELLKVTDSMGHVSTLQWDSLGRKLASQDPDLGLWAYAYDAAGNLLTLRDAKNQVTTYTYDALNRVKTKTTAAGDVTTWMYDETGYGYSKGRLTRVLYPQSTGTELHSYDKRGLETSVTRVITGVTNRIQHAYDALGRLRYVTYPDAERITNSYNAFGQLTKCAPYVSSLTWNSRGQLLTMTYANGTKTTYTYDTNRAWLKTAKVAVGTSNRFEAKYYYRPNGLVQQETSLTDPSMNNSYAYDGFKRLISVTGAQPQAFTYDAIGNMLTNSHVGPYTYADPAHAHAVTQAGPYAFTYDANGNMLSSSSGWMFEWDAENRLRAVNGASSATYLYAPGGQRIQKSCADGVLRYFGLVEDVNGSLVKYYYAGGILVAKQEGGSTTWYHSDRLGSIRALTGASGARIQSYAYGAYGDTTEQSGTVRNERGYTGHITDSDTGLIYMGARYHSGPLGRFISPDTVVPDPANPQALNRYAYAYNNPINNTDPTGHVPVIAAVAAGAIASANAIGTAAAGFVIAASTVGSGLSIAGYFTKDPIMSSVGSVMLGFAGGYSGALGENLGSRLAGGLLGGAHSGLTSPASPLDTGAKQAVGWAYSVFGRLTHPGSTLSGAIQATAQAEALQAGVRAFVGFLSKEAGISEDKFNAALMVGSITGNLLLGSRNIVMRNGSAEAQADMGVASRYNGVLNPHKVGDMRFLSLPFDAMDILLVWQGLPSASGFEYLMKGDAGLISKGFSLGAAERNNLVALGLNRDTEVGSLPVLQTLAPGVAGWFAPNDLASLFGAGPALNPSAEVIGNVAHNHSKYPLFNGWQIVPGAW